MPKVTPHRQGTQAVCFLIQGPPKPDLQFLTPPGQATPVQS